MRLKVRLTIQKEVQKGTILQQSFTVMFVVRNQQCIECQAEFRQGSWKSLVQVRQRVSHQRTFFYLEQLILNILRCVGVGFSRLSLQCSAICFASFHYRLCETVCASSPVLRFAFAGFTDSSHFYNFW